MHLSSTGLPPDPMRSIAHRLDHLRGQSSDISMCSCRNDDGAQNQVPASSIQQTLHTSATATKSPSKGFPLKKTSTCLLQAGGAMALHLAGADEKIIKMNGRWRQETWKRHIHPAIPALKSSTSKITQKMATASLTLINLARHQHQN